MFISCEGGRNRVCFLDGDVTVPLGTMRATGDFVTIKDGEIFFLGRKDSQIKRHGKRLNIELVQQVNCSNIKYLLTYIGIRGSHN